MAVAHVWTHFQFIDYGYRISQATKQNRRLTEVNRRLRLEVAMLKRPERVALIAGTDLGLRPVEPEQVRRLPTPAGRELAQRGRVSSRPKARGASLPQGAALSTASWSPRSSQ
jgi:cell division protein FtsL